MSTSSALSDSGEHYTIIKNAISKEICELLSDYANFKANLRPNVRKNDPLAGVHREYGDPLMETLLQKLTPMIEKATGLELWPTLSFYYTYKNGNQLLRHKDRSSCQIVAGLCIGADQAFKENKKGWPLILNYEGKPTPIVLDEGDLVIFRGHETEHWREKFNGAWYVSAIFAYVDKNGEYCFQKYDQRKRLGKPHVGMFRWLFGSFKNKVKRLILGNNDRSLRIRQE